MVAVRLGLHAGAVFKLELAVWILGPLPLVLTNAAFLKLHHVFVVSYATSWLVKLCIVATGVAVFA